jgi:hypothetical protein
MSFTEESIQNNPGLARAVMKALAKEDRPPVKFKLQELQQINIEVSRSSNKYNVVDANRRTNGKGIKFASRGEMLHYEELVLVEKSGAIADLQRQVTFILQEEFISKQKEWGNVAAIIYVADYVYKNISYRKGYEGRICVEDWKGSKEMLTAAYKLKRRLFLYKFASYAFFEVYPD